MTPIAIPWGIAVAVFLITLAVGVGWGSSIPCEHEVAAASQPKPLCTFKVDLRLQGSATVHAAAFSSDEIWTKFVDPDERIIVMYKTEDVKSIVSAGVAA